jgi:hypothetical protein
VKTERLVMQACCGGRKAVAFRLDRPVDQALLDVLTSQGFTSAEHFRTAGMLYADNPALIVSGPFGSDRLNVKCKKADCDQNLNDFEELLIRTG